MKTGYIVIIAYARSGSTLLCGLLDTFSDAKVYREIFHYHLATIRQSLGGDADAILGQSEMSDKDQRTAVALNPKAYLDKIGALNVGASFVFKAFNGHLPPKSLKTVIEGSEAVIVLRRNLVHSFISNEIANARQVWGGAETSSDEVTFDAQKFFSYCRGILEFQKTALEIASAASIKTLEICYEDIAEPELGQQNVLSVMDELGISRRPNPQPRLIPRRQDARRFASDKVTNKVDLQAALQQLGAESADDGAQPMEMDAVLTKLRAISP